MARVPARRLVLGLPASDKKFNQTTETTQCEKWYEGTLLGLGSVKCEVAFAKFDMLKPPTHNWGKDPA